MKKSNDVKRLEEITKVILKNDLKSGISPSKVCNILAELGPTFIKIGQILSTRIDLIPKEYCAALSNLRNNNGAVISNIPDNITIPINVFIASFLPSIFIENTKRGI